MKRMKHFCHAIGCIKEVEPRLLMCPTHWRMVPRSLQHDVWNTYVPGQEQTKLPTEEYLDAAKVAIQVVRELEGK